MNRRKWDHEAIEEWFRRRNFNGKRVFLFFILCFAMDELADLHYFADPCMGCHNVQRTPGRSCLILFSCLASMHSFKVFIQFICL